MTLALLLAAQTWKPVTISFYSMGKVTADGTKMKQDGSWVATWRYPLGTKVEVKVGDVTLRLVVRDRTAKRFGNRFDIPKGTWLRFGQPASRGLLKGHERRVK